MSVLYLLHTSIFKIKNKTLQMKSHGFFVCRKLRAKELMYIKQKNNDPFKKQMREI